VQAPPIVYAVCTAGKVQFRSRDRRYRLGGELHKGFSGVLTAPQRTMVAREAVSNFARMGLPSPKVIVLEVFVAPAAAVAEPA